MKTRIPKFITVTVILLLAGLFWQMQGRDESPSHDRPDMATLGSVDTLLAAYERWKARTAANGGDRNLVLSLRYNTGLSAAFTKAAGGVRLDLVDGTVDVKVVGLAEEETFDLWLIDNRPGPGRSVTPEPGDVMVHLGSLQHEEGSATLHANLSTEQPPDFQLDFVAVTRAGEGPAEGGLLFGSPNLFQRLYHSELRGLFAARGDEAAPVADEATRPSLLTAPFRALIPSPAHAMVAESVAADLLTAMEASIARGQRLFFRETFAGNGRTCGTCHPDVNNLTVDPAFIASRPCEDLLFVAEHAADPTACPPAQLQNPSLATLERPRLMRQFGLILENQDGFDNLERNFNMRGVPHTLALSTSIDALNAVPGLDNGPFEEMTGWSGDGSPFLLINGECLFPEDGSLRAFAIGAVRQHFPQSLDRVEGVDFVLPTPDELDDLEAFQLSLGRDADPDLRLDNVTGAPVGLTLKGAVPKFGHLLFVNGSPDDDAGTIINGGRCNACHFNAGASFSATPGAAGSNINTQVEILENAQVRLDGVQRFPCDAGFGTVPGSFDDLCNPLRTSFRNQVFGDGRFNTPSLVEAADTGPFFHNNTITTIEGAVAFYNSNAFNDPRGPATQFALQASEVEAIAAFLRVINALENVRNSITLDERAVDALVLAPGANVQRLLRVSRADLLDGIEVLSAVSLHLDAVAFLKEARTLLKEALAATCTVISCPKADLIKQAIPPQQQARNRMCVRGSDNVLCPQ